jgi:hypothetical protein
MRSGLTAALLITTGLLLAGCGAVKRAAVAGIVAVQSDAVLTQSTFKDLEAPAAPAGHSRCDGMRSARLNVAGAASSSKVAWSFKVRTVSRQMERASTSGPLVVIACPLPSIRIDGLSPLTIVATHRRIDGRRA